MQNIIDYAELHQYHLQLSGHVDKDRHPAWSKVKAWQHLLQRYDWVWQTDADMAILDMHRRLETFLDSDYDIIIGRDCSTFHDLLDHGFNASEALRASVNTGSFFLRSSPWTSEFLRKLYEYNGSHIPNIDIWWDNAAMIHFIQMDQIAGHPHQVGSRAPVQCMATKHHTLFQRAKCQPSVQPYRDCVLRAG